MRKKLRGKAGLTMVEMLAATAILLLLSLMLNTGLQMTLDTYENMIAQSELELLVTTAVDALADDLRYARNVDGSKSGGKCDFTYTSDSFYGDEVYLDLDNHQIIARTDETNGMRVLSTGSYGNGGVSYKEYWITDLSIKLQKNTSGEITFTIELTAETADGKLTASTPEGGVTVRCLNPPKVDTTP